MNVVYEHLKSVLKRMRRRIKSGELLNLDLVYFL